MYLYFSKTKLKIHPMILKLNIVPGCLTGGLSDFVTESLPCHLKNNLINES